MPQTQWCNTDVRADPWFRLPAPPSLGSVVVIGAGLAGCALARSLAERGVSVQVLDTAGEAASGASGNPVAVVKPFVTRQPSRGAEFYRIAWRHLTQRLQDFGKAVMYRPCGVLQLTNTPYPPGDDYTVLSPAEASEYAGVPIRAPALWFAEAGWIAPRSYCQALLQHPAIELRQGVRVCGAVSSTRGSWTLALSSGVPIHASCVVLANGPRGIAAAARLTPIEIPAATLQDVFGIEALPLIPARGQLSRFHTVHSAPRLQTVVCGRRYAIPTDNGVTVGATFERNCSDADARAADDADNLRALQQLLPELHVVAYPYAHHAGVRITTPDRLPLAGPMPDLAAYPSCYANLHHGRIGARYPLAPVRDRVYVLGGLGSRGCISAGFAAELLARHLTGDGAALEAWIDLLHPARFAVRALKRAPPSH